MTLLTRLLVPVACAVLPPAVALLYTQQEASRDDRDRREREVLAQAELAAAELAGVLEAAHQFMRGEARARRAGATGCGEAPEAPVVRLASDPGRHAFLVALDGDGRPSCGGSPGAGTARDGAFEIAFGTTPGRAPRAIPDAVRHAAAEAALRRGFAVGRFGRAEGEMGPFLPLALPLAPPVPPSASSPPAESRDEPGVLVLGLSLERLGERMAASPRPFGGAALIVDRDGTVVARTPGARLRPGQALGPAWARRLRSAAPGTAAVADEGGGVGPVGYVPVGEAPAPLFALAEAPSPSGGGWAGLAPAAWRGLALVASCALLGVALAAWAAHRLIRVPVVALLSAARRRAGGEAAPRAAPREAPNTEFGQLARAFDALADAEAERRAEVRRLSAAFDARLEERTRALREANRRLRAEAAEHETAAAGVRQAQKLQAVGQLAGGVAHEFNNLLTGVLGSLELLRQRTPVEARDQRRLIGTALDAAQRGGRLTSQLLWFSREQRLDPRATDLNDALGGMARMLEAALGAGVRFESRLEPRPWPAWVDRDGFEAAILNLVLNGRDAMPGGGRLLIATANRTVGPDDAAGDLSPGDYVAVVVADSGTGMTVETLSRAFEPFFTTKPPGQGTGLGLSQVHGLVRQFGGDVRITSRPGGGTRVTLLLPRAPADAPPEGRAGAPAGAPTGAPTGAPADAAADARGEARGEARGRTGGHAPPAPAPRRPPGEGEILLVDDDDAVRDVTALMLSEAGHRVHRAAGAEEALRLLAEHGDAVRVLVADYAMPGMNGLELIALVRRGWPGISALLATGCAEPPDLRDQGQAGPDGIVHKPYRGRELLARVRRAMQHRRVQDAGPV